MHKVYFKNQQGAVARLIKYNQKFYDQACRNASDVNVIVGEPKQNYEGLTVQEYYSLDHNYANDVEVISFGCDDGGVYVAVLAPAEYTFKSARVSANTATNGHRLSYEEIVERDLIKGIRILAVVLEEQNE